MYAPDKVATHSGASFVEGLMVWKRGDRARTGPLYGGFLTFSDNGVRL